MKIVVTATNFVKKGLVFLVKKISGKKLASFLGRSLTIYIEYNIILDIYGILISLPSISSQEIEKILKIDFATALFVEASLFF